MNLSNFDNQLRTSTLKDSNVCLCKYCPRFVKACTVNLFFSFSRLDINQFLVLSCNCMPNLENILSTDKPLKILISRR